MSVLTPRCRREASSRQRARSRLVRALVRTSMAFLCGCVLRDTVWEGSAVLNANNPLVIVPRRALDMTGPTTEVCVTPVDQGATVEGDSIVLSGRRRVHMSVLLIGVDGWRDSLFRDNHNWRIQVKDGRRDSTPVGPEQPQLDKFGGDEACLWNHEEMYRVSPRRKVARLELRADHDMAISKVRWWSGQRHALP